MTYKRKKFLIKIVLMIVTVSTLLSCFSIFGSAAATDNSIPWFYVPENTLDTSVIPQYPGASYDLYSRFIGDDWHETYVQKNNLMLYLDNSNRLYFSTFCFQNSSNPWYLLPVTSSNHEGTYQQQFTALNHNQIVNKASDTDWRLSSPMINDLVYDLSVRYPDFGDDYYIDYSCQAELSPKGSLWSSLPYDWIPMYAFVAFFDVLAYSVDLDAYYLDNAYFDQNFFNRQPSIPDNLISNVNSGFGFVSYDVVLNNNSPIRVPVLNVPQEDSKGNSIVGGSIYCRTTLYKKSSVLDSNGNYKPQSEWEFYENGSYTGHLWSDGCFFFRPTAFNVVTVDQYNQSLKEVSTSRYNEGYSNGKSDGYSQGKAEGLAQGENWNAVDGLLTLAKVPGTFISSMLDFNFFGINLANTVKVIFTVLVLAFIVVILLKFLL